jgi:hypothetical protein
MPRKPKESGEFKNTFIEERISYLIPQFEKLAPFTATKRKNGDTQQGITGWKKLASRETVVLKDKYPDERKESEKTFSTATAQLTVLKRELMKAAKSQLKDPANFHKVETIITHFHQELVSHFSSYKERANIEYRERVENRSNTANLIKVDLADYLQKANQVLTDLENGSNQDWRDVSCALSLVTGRRQSEIHHSAEFREVGDYEVEFKGQLKGKTRKEKGVSLKEAVFRIPTLVKAHLVVNALSWLEENGKRAHGADAVDVVNGRWGKPLALSVKTDWNVISDDKWQEIDLKDKMTYHKFRAIYLICALANLDKTGMKMLDKAKYCEQILGDRDLKAMQPYERVQLEEGSITQI